MKKSISILFVVLVLISCSDSHKKNTLITDSRKLYVYELDSLIREMKYDLSIEVKDSVTYYRYKFPFEKRKDFNFKFYRYEQKINFGPFEFKKTQKNKYKQIQISSFYFDLYEINEFIIDGNGPILFNPDYGVLTVDNGWGTQVLFLKENNDKELTNGILDLLNK